MAVSGCFAPNRFPEESETGAANETSGSTEPSTSSSGDAGGASVTTGPSASATATTGSSSDTTEGSATQAGAESAAESADEEGTASDSGTSECDGRVCLEVPDGWSGPVLVEEGTVGSTSDCGTTEAFIANTGLNASAAGCECECGDPGVDCDGQLTTLNRASSGGCMDFTASEEMVNNGCTDTAYYDDSWMWFRVEDADTAGESCDPSFSESVPPASWTNEVRGCEAPQSSSCGDSGTCLDFETSGLDVCIWRPGDEECPSQSFTKTVAYQGFSDTRACTDCSCGNVVGECTGQITYNSNETCSLGAQGPVDELDCFFLETPARSASVSVSSDYSCSPIGGAATGDAEPTQPVTYCCR